MKTTNTLLGFISLILFLNLFKNLDFTLFAKASAQGSGLAKKKNDTINIKIVDIGTGVFSGSLPVLYGSKYGIVYPKRTQSDPDLFVLPVSFPFR